MRESKISQVQLFQAYFKKMNSFQRWEALDFMGYILTKDIRGDAEVVAQKRTEIAHSALSIMRKVRSRASSKKITRQDIQEEIDRYRAA